MIILSIILIIILFSFYSEINEFLNSDLGPDNSFYPLKGQCYEYTDREYTFKLCPFDRVTQRPKNGGTEFNLG